MHKWAKRRSLPKERIIFTTNFRLTSTPCGNIYVISAHLISKNGLGDEAMTLDGLALKFAAAAKIGEKSADIKRAQKSLEKGISKIHAKYMEDSGVTPQSPRDGTGFVRV